MNIRKVKDLLMKKGRKEEDAGGAKTTAPHLRLGKSGEEIAAGYLRDKGYRIAEMNWKTGIGEVDIIAQIGRTLVCVEVKTRSTAAFGYPEESVTAKKREKLKKLAEIYQSLHNLKSFPRIDVISIEVTQGGESLITHFEDVGWQ